MSDFEVRGSDQFRRLSKALKESRPAVRKAVLRGLRDAVKDVEPEAAQALADALPSGLKSRGAAVKQAIMVRSGGDPGLSVVVRFGAGGRGLGAINAKLVNQAGTIRHPVYKTGAWVAQRVGGQGWFDKTYMNAAPEIRDRLERELVTVIDNIVKKAR